MLSARSPKYPALYDEESGVRFHRGKAAVTEEQARILARRRFMDGIVIGEFDAEGFSVNELPAKKWVQEHAESTPGAPVESAEVVEGGEAVEVSDQSGTDDQPDAATQGRRRNKQ